MTYNGNQLVKVRDTGAVSSHPGSADFRSGSAADIQYLYDANGNMTKDLNKGISNIGYNSLNLPKSLTISNSTGSATNAYVYDANGTKLSVSKGGSRTDYVGNVIYENGSLKRILVDGGYNEGGVYYFYITDHLGNNRVVANQNAGVIQTTDYHPFGMAFADGTGQDTQPYKFGGKEFERKDGLNLYDYSARYMDPALGRFTTMDPMAEKYYAWSPYAYCANNPVRFVDPTGMDWYSYGEEYEDENGDLQTRTQYKYVEGTMSNREMENGGYKHLGKTYTSGSTYYSLGGSEIKYDFLDPQGMNAMSMIRNADNSILATIDAIEGVGDFWNKYNGVISTGSSVATVLSEYMGASKEIASKVKIAGNFISGVSIIFDVQSYLNGDLKGMALMDAAINVVSLAGAPGAAISLSYSGSKEITKGIDFLKSGSEVRMKGSINSIFSWMGANQLIR